MSHKVCESDVETLPLPPEVVCGGDKPLKYNHWVDWTRTTKVDEPYSDVYNTRNIKVIAVKDNLDPVDNRDKLHPFIIQLEFRKGEVIYQTQAQDENGFCFGFIPSSAFFGRDRFGYYKPNMVEIKCKKKKSRLRKLIGAFKKKQRKKKTKDNGAATKLTN